jgi:4-carboxymuconolactone decarboxylase
VTLGEKDQRLVRLTIATVLGHAEEIRALRVAAPEGEPDREWREAILQAHVFAGFPRVIEALEALMRAGGFAPESEVDAPTESGCGNALFECIYAEQTDAVRGRLEALDPQLGAWIQEYAYGTVLCRPGLSAARRELLVVAALTVLGQRRQLASHVRGALRCGAREDEVLSVLALTQPYVDDEAFLQAEMVAQHFLADEPIA